MVYLYCRGSDLEQNGRVDALETETSPIAIPLLIDSDPPPAKWLSFERSPCHATRTTLAPPPRLRIISRTVRPASSASLAPSFFRAALLRGMKPSRVVDHAASVMTQLLHPESGGSQRHAAYLTHANWRIH